MKHILSLQDKPFEAIRDGFKTIELRLCDDKRSKIRVGDIIEFVSPNCENCKILCKVLKIYQYETFKELYANLPNEKFGYKKYEIKEDSYKDMEHYYSLEKQKQFKVLGIEFKKI